MFVCFPYKKKQTNRQNREYQGDLRDKRDLREDAISRKVRAIALVSIVSMVPIVSKKYYITMTHYRYQLERYRGRSTRHVCPQCGRKNVFTRYVDTENNNIYISEKVGKCNRLDKCGYHYTPHQYFTDNPWKRDKDCLFVYLHRENKQTNKQITYSLTQRTGIALARCIERLVSMPFHVRVLVFRLKYNALALSPSTDVVQ